MNRQSVKYNSIMSDDSIKSIMTKTSSDVYLKMKQKIDKNVNFTSQIFSCKIKDVLRMCADGHVIGYDQNRGNGKYSKVTAKSVCEELNLNAFGEIIAGNFKKFNRFILADGHGRVAGIVMRYNNGKMTDVELNTSISFKIVREEDFLEVYQKANRSQKHSSSQCLSNQDLGFGRYQKIVLDRLPKEVAEFFDKASYSTVFSQILYGLDRINNKKINSVRSFHDIYGLRLEMSKKSNFLPNELNLNVTEKQIDKLCEAMKFYYDYFSFIEKNAPKDSKRAFKAVGWMGAIVTDKVFDCKMFHSRSNELANASIQHCITVNRALPNITRCKKSDTHSVLMDINEVLRGRKARITQF